MARLIDADELRERALRGNIPLATSSEMMVRLVDIDAAPTVDAEPVMIKNGEIVVTSRLPRTSWQNTSGRCGTTLDDKRLAEIRERAEVVFLDVECNPNMAEYLAEFDVPELLAEVERLRTAEESLTVENARLRAELEAAKGDLHELAQCVSCKHSYAKGMRCQIPSKERVTDGDRCHTWDWCGVPANTPAQGATDETRGGGEG